MSKVNRVLRDKDIPLRSAMLMHPSNAIHRICKEGDFVRLCQMLAETDDQEETVNLTNEGGATPLIFAAAHGHVKICKLLLDSGADIRAVSKLGGYSALHMACERGHADVVRCLLEKRPELVEGAFTGSKETPLHSCARAGHQRICKYLLDNGMDPDALTLTMWTPLHLAASNGHFAVAKALVSAGANVLLRTKRGLVATDLVDTSFRKLLDFLQDETFATKSNILATGPCKSLYCTCQHFQKGTKRHACQCGHSPLDHCDPARVDEARRVLATTGRLAEVFGAIENDAHGEALTVPRPTKGACKDTPVGENDHDSRRESGGK